LLIRQRHAGIGGNGSKIIPTAENAAGGAQGARSQIWEARMSFAVPAKILEEYSTSDLAYKSRGNRVGLVEFGNTRRPVSLDLVPDAHEGDYVLIDNGFAIERISASEADKAYEQLRASGHWDRVELDLERVEEAPESLRRQRR
jgi:hydrogenase assembly chaperone HypC/HupF